MKHLPWKTNIETVFILVFLQILVCLKQYLLVPEIQFSAEGAKMEVLHLDYIQAPILLNLD